MRKVALACGLLALTAQGRNVRPEPESNGAKELASLLMALSPESAFNGLNPSNAAARNHIHSRLARRTSATNMVYVVENPDSQPDEEEMLSRKQEIALKMMADMKAAGQMPEGWTLENQTRVNDYTVMKDARGVPVELFARPDLSMEEKKIIFGRNWVWFDQGESDFDGGDSGGGVVGDGNMDFADQHNSAELLDSQEKRQSAQATRVKGGVARIMSAGANYFGKSTEGGLAEQMIKRGMDPVRAQQYENFENQKKLYQQQLEEDGFYIRNPKASRFGENWANRHLRMGKEELEEPDTGDLKDVLANQKEKHAYQYADRLDGEPWGEFTLEGAEWQDEIVFGVESKGVQFKIVEIKNEVAVYSPFRVGVIGQDAKNFAPNIHFGTLDKRGQGVKPLELPIRWFGQKGEAVLIFETEEFKYAYKLIGL